MASKNTKHKSGEYKQKHEATSKKMLAKTDASEKSQQNNVETKDSCRCKSWTLIPLRIALGLMFFIAGLPRLAELLSGSPGPASYLAGLGIPWPGLFAWILAIVQTFCGLFLIFGTLICISSSLLSIVMLVALITTALKPLDWFQVMVHLVFISGLLAVMHGPRLFGLCNCHNGKKCSCCAFGCRSEDCKTDACLKK